MRISNDRIKDAYKKAIKDTDYISYEQNKLLNQGDSASAFYSDILRRVRLEYGGLINQEGGIEVIERVKNSLVTNYQPFKDLIVANGILSSISNLISAYATAKEIKNIEEMKHLELQNLISEGMQELTSIGSLLIKGVIEEKSESLYIVPITDYFPIFSEYNPAIIEAYVVYEKVDTPDFLKETVSHSIKCELYTEGLTEYFTANFGKEGNLIISSYGDDLENNGAEETEEGILSIKYNGWLVSECRNNPVTRKVYGCSDFTKDVKSKVREIICNDTTTSQVFSKLLKPFLQVPRSLIEYDKNGVGKVMLNDKVIILNPEDREVKSVDVQTKTLEWIEQRKKLLDDILIDLGVSYSILGISESASANRSGEANYQNKERSYMAVNSKRNKIKISLEEVIRTIMEVQGKTLDKEWELEIPELVEDDVVVESQLQKTRAETIKILNDMRAITEVDGIIKEMSDRLIDDFGLGEYLDA